MAEAATGRQDERARVDESDKSAAMAAIERLPDSAIFDDILEEVKVLIALREADEDIAAGRVIPHEEVKRIVATWR
jgi:predicted transcriptional regulator